MEKLAVAVLAADVAEQTPYIGDMDNLFNAALESLPVDLSDFIQIARSGGALRILEDNTVSRLIEVLLNDEDERVSSKV